MNMGEIEYLEGRECLCSAPATVTIGARIGRRVVLLRYCRPCARDVLTYVGDTWEIKSE